MLLLALLAWVEVEVEAEGKVRYRHVLWTPWDDHISNRRRLAQARVKYAFVRIEITIFATVAIRLILRPTVATSRRPQRHWPLQGHWQGRSEGDDRMGCDDSKFSVYDMSKAVWVQAKG